MKRQKLILVFGFFFSFGFAQQDVKKLNAAFDKVIVQDLGANETGITVLVSQKGQVIYKKGFGKANLELNVSMQPDQVFRIGSITKQFTAIAILQLAEQGKLDLQDNITRFIPDYPTQGYTITIEHLLTHTSGISSFTGMNDYLERMTLDLAPEEVIDHFKNQPMKFAPGTKWEYSNSGYFLLGYIIEKITGKSYADYLEEHFFKPIGMTSSVCGNDTRLIKKRAGTYRMGKNGIENALPLSMTQPFSAGSIQSTVEDLYKWNLAVQSGKLVKKENLEKAFANHKLTDGTLTDYGYGWQLGYIQDSPSIEHGGAINGSSTMAIYLPKEDVYVAIFSNCECYQPGDLAAKLAAIAIGKPYAYKEITLQDSVLQEYTGVYENEKGEERLLTVSGNKLYSQRGRNPKFVIKASQADRFFFEDALVTIEFVRNSGNTIEKLVLQGRKGKEVWSRTNKRSLTTTVEIKVDEKILDTYVGEYALAPGFTFVVTREGGRLFVQATGQERFEIFAEEQHKFFTKVNDAQFEFVTDALGNVSKVLLSQNGKKMEAGKINK
jgi:CubicO group peptidase (beta-lactamase class C family)